MTRWLRRLFAPPEVRVRLIDSLGNTVADSLVPATLTDPLVNARIRTESLTVQVDSVSTNHMRTRWSGRVDMFAQYRP
jgi:hypothetical protein